METDTGALLGLCRLQGRLYLNCLTGVTDADAARRAGDGGNNLVFLAAHLLDARAYLAGVVGDPYEHPFAVDWREVQSMEQLTDPPPLSSLAEAWVALGEVIEARFRDCRDWSAEVEQSFPNGGGTRRDATAFLVHHEAYHIGQMALLRRQLGYPAMTYD